MLELRGADLIPALFSVHAPCEPRQADWFLDLYVAVRDALEIDPAFVPPAGGGFSALNSPPWKDVDGPLTGGIRVVGRKKGKRGDALLVEYALFDNKGRALAWSGGLSQGVPSRPAQVTFMNADYEPLYHDVDLKKRIRDLVKANPPAADKGPFEVSEPLASVAVSPDGDLVLAIDQRNTITAFDGSHGVLVGIIKIRSKHDPIRNVAFSPGGDRFVTGARALAIYGARTLSPMLTLEGHPKGRVMWVAWSPCGRFIASASWVSVRGKDKSMVLWDAETGEALQKWTDHEGYSWVGFDDDALFCATVRPWMVQRIDLSSLETLTEWDVGYSSRPLSRVSDGWAVPRNGEVVVLDPKTLTPLRTLTHEAFTDLEPDAMATPGGQELVVTGTRTFLMDSGTGEELRELPMASSYCKAVSCGGPRVAAVSDRVAAVWDLSA